MSNIVPCEVSVNGISTGTSINKLFVGDTQMDSITFKQLPVHNDLINTELCTVAPIIGYVYFIDDGTNYIMSINNGSLCATKLTELVDHAESIINKKEELIKDMIPYIQGCSYDTMYIYDQTKLSIYPRSPNMLNHVSLTSDEYEHVYILSDELNIFYKGPIDREALHSVLKTESEFIISKYGITPTRSALKDEHISYCKLKTAHKDLIEYLKNLPQLFIAA